MGLDKVNQDDVYNIVKNIFLCPLFITFPRPPTPILAQDWGMYSALCRSVALAAFGYSDAYEDIWRYMYMYYSNYVFYHLKKNTE